MGYIHIFEFLMRTMSMKTCTSDYPVSFPTLMDLALSKVVPSAMAFGVEVIKESFKERKLMKYGAVYPEIGTIQN